MSFAVLRPGELTSTAVERALVESGGFLLQDPSVADLARDTLITARRFFDLPGEVKRELAIARSPHFRGWSEMRNERDWREQIHFGRERDALASGPEYLQLEGPNLWPPDPAFRAAVTRYLEVVAGAGERLLATIAEGFGFPRNAFGETARDGYQLLKLICYWAQPQVRADRPGVAAHVDFSYVTLTLQDGPGLSVREADGTWQEVEPLAGAWWVHAGELLQFATCGFHEATPHRVTNRSADRTRLSLPFFVNPPLDAVVRAFDTGRSREIRPHAEHVHHVLSREASGDVGAPFVFGEAEWRRKGLNHWCVDCTPR